MTLRTRTTAEIAVDGCVLMHAAANLAKEFTDRPEFAPFDDRTVVSLIGNASVAHGAFLRFVEFGEPIPYQDFESFEQAAAALNFLCQEIADNRELCLDTPLRELAWSVMRAVTWHVEND